MIVRIATEGQYELGPGGSSALDELERQALKACQGNDEEKFRSSYERLLDLVRTQGEPLSDDQLVGSDLILPPPDVSLEEAQAEFTGEGLIPS